MLKKIKKSLLIYSPVHLSNGGGFEDWLKRTTYLLRNNYDITLAIGDINYRNLNLGEKKNWGFSERTKITNISYFSFCSLAYLIKPTSVVVLWRLFRQSDIVYFNGAFAFQEIIIYLISKCTSKKIIVGFHAPVLFNHAHDLWFRAISSRIFSKFNACHVLTPSARDFFIKRGFKRIHLIPNYLLDQEIPTQLAKFYKGSYGFVGTFNKNKGTDLLINSIKQYFFRYPQDEVKFHFFGRGPYEKEIRSLTKSFPKKVIYHGYVQNKHEIYKKIGFLLQFSRRESFGLAALEALGRGVPVIASKTEGAKFLVDDRINGYLINNFETEDLIKYIRLTSSLSNGEISRMRLNAQKKVRRLFTEDVFKKRFLCLVENL